MTDQVPAAAKRAYTCRICKQPKKGHVCSGVPVVTGVATAQPVEVVADEAVVAEPVADEPDIYDHHSYCQICMNEYSSDNIKAGPLGSRSCHFCCTACFNRIIKKVSDGTVSYQCPWCRKSFRIAYDTSNMTSEFESYSIRVQQARRRANRSGDDANPSLTSVSHLRFIEDEDSFEIAARSYMEYHYQLELTRHLNRLRRIRPAR